MARQAIARAERDGEPSGAPIGYRRLPVRISHEGWVLDDVPGSFAERRTDEEWWGGGAGRGITLAAVDTGTLSAEAFLDQVASGLGPDVLDHRAGPVVGRGRLTSDASSGVAVGVVDGLLGRGRFRCGDPRRLRRSRRLAVGARDLARTRPGLRCRMQGRRAMLLAMYVPAHFKPDDDEVRELLRNLGAADLVTSTADGLLATMLPLLWIEPTTGSDGWGVAAWPRRAQQPPVEGAAGRRGDGDRPRPERVHLAGLVRDEARARSRGPDVELHHRACPRPARHP